MTTTGHNKLLCALRLVQAVERWPPGLLELAAGLGAEVGGVVTTLAGEGSIEMCRVKKCGCADERLQMQFDFPNGVAVDDDDNIYVADAGNTIDVLPYMA